MTKLPMDGLFRSCRDCACLASAPAMADRDGQYRRFACVLIKPKAPRAMCDSDAGGDGNIRRATRAISTVSPEPFGSDTACLCSARMAVLVVDAAPISVARLIYGPPSAPVTVIGTSRGTIRAAEELRGSHGRTRWCLTSGFLSLDFVQQFKMSCRSRLTGVRCAHPLFIHHSQDRLQSDIAGGRRSVHQMVGWSRARDLDKRRAE